MKVFCRKCRTEVSNEFDNTLTFCTNCGEKLSFSDAEAEARTSRKSSLRTIILTSFFTAVFLLAGVGVVFYAYSVFQSDKSNGGISAKPTPAPLKNPVGAVPASEITKVEYVRWSHYGSMSSGDGRVVSNRIGFSRELTGFKIEENNYDSGDEKDRRVQFDTRIGTAHFEKLAEIVAERDFMNLPDSSNRISERDAYLVVSYKGGEKKILTSNTGADIPQIDEILRTLTAIELGVDWKPAK